MFPLDTPSSQLLYATVMVVATLNDGQSSTGTGFFFSFKVDQERQIPMLVTNKHVVLNAKSIKIVVHEGTKQENGKYLPSSKSFPIEIHNPGFIDHPGSVDLCAMPFEPLRAQAEAQGKHFFYVMLDETLLPTEEILSKLAAVEDVVMVGYPIGLWDQRNNFPIIRRGITASHPVTDFNGEPVGLADIAAFPGSSGSPVLLLNVGGYSAPGGAFVIGSRAMLLGILYGGPQFGADGTIHIEEIPTKRAPVAKVNIPTHIGMYVKAKELLTLRQHVFETLQVK
jgi:hypothetical protein